MCFSFLWFFAISHKAEFQDTEKIKEFKKLILKENLISKFNGNLKENVDRIIWASDPLRNKIDYLIYNGEADYILSVLVDFDVFSPDVTDKLVTNELTYTFEDPSSIKVIFCTISFSGFFMPSKEYFPISLGTQSSSNYPFGSTGPFRFRKKERSRG